MTVFLWLCICAICALIGFLGGHFHWSARYPLGINTLATECANERRRADEAEAKLAKVHRVVNGLPV